MGWEVGRKLKMGFLRQEYWSGSFSSGPHFVRTLHHDPSILAPYMAWCSFIELDKAVVHVIRLVSFLWLWFQSLCPLMPSLSIYHLTGVSLTLDVERSFLKRSLEGLMLKLKLQYFGHLMRRADSFEKTLMLGKIEGSRRRGRQRMRW